MQRMEKEIMALCDICQHLKMRKSKTWVVCRERGTIKQRANNCVSFAGKKQKQADLLAWTGVS